MWHTDPFTHRHFYTDTFTHRPFYTETSWHRAASEIKWKRPFWKSNGNGRFGPKPSEKSFGTRFWTLAPCGPAIGDQGQRAVFGQILARSFLEPAFGTLAACGQATKSAFWDQGETAVLGQILARSLLEPDFGTLAACGDHSAGYWISLIGSRGNGRFWLNPGQKPVGSNF